MKRLVFRVTLVFIIFALTVPAILAETIPVKKANYELAARWTSAKAGKLVFDTSVSPHWLEFSERFWYSYETSRSRSYYIVDPLRRTKVPVYDNAKMAAMLTKIVLTPYDAQHLPITAFKFIKKDTAIQFELEVQKDIDVMTSKGVIKAGDIGKEKAEKEKAEKEKEKALEQEKDKDKKDVEKGKEAEKPKEEESKTMMLGFEYDLATGKLTLLEDYEAPPTRPRWSSLSPDEKTVIFARGDNLFMMDAESYALAQKKATDPKIKEVQLTTDGVERYSYARELNDEEKKQ